MNEKGILIVGVGNPIRGDDSAGIEVIKRLKEFSLPQNVEMRKVSTGGIPLVEQFLDFGEIILIDAIYDLSQGVIEKFRVDEIKSAEDSSGVHGMGLVESLNSLRNIYPERTPKEENIKIFGIGINPNENFSEELSEAVERAVEKVSSEIRERIMNLDEEEQN